MKNSKNIQAEMANPEFLAGGGELGERMREFDWSSTDLGPVNDWPQSLKTCVRIMLTSRQPIWIGWGPKLIKLYNDPYIKIVGGKHPWALGKPASEVWKDIWDDIEPMLKTVMEKDQGTYVESQLLIMERNGYPEETYYTFSYTPIPGDDGKTAGMFCANTDDTVRIIQERQLKTLSNLAKRLIDSKTTENVFQKTIEVLQENPHDFPFTIIRTIVGDKAVLAASTDLGEFENKIEKEVDLKSDGPVSDIIRKVLVTKEPVIFSDKENRMHGMPKGAWKTPPRQSILIPITLSGATNPMAILVVGLNPYRALNEQYHSFFSLIADQVTTSIIEVRSQEEERKRVQALAELDKAKTTFFSNISHEFRTPLTLLLGPIEEVINRNSVAEDDRSSLTLALRNGLRMQKLVNTLLDFSRAEAGRLTGRFRKVDIISFTRELSALFQPIVENAGIKFNFEASPIKNEVYVDPEMWEKIIVNLLSNAFKYTDNGSISVSLKTTPHSLRVSVTDTGIGIPQSQLNKIFDRFHRVESSGGRSQEGTGIGLAMVRELVKVHKGNITVESAEGAGSTFTVELPLGRQHLVNEYVQEDTTELRTNNTSKAYIEEAKRWQPEDPAISTNSYSGSNTGYKVILADDNADMREYVTRVLSEKFNVVVAGNGEEALKIALDSKPDLILTDIMMPIMDGYELLKKLRDYPDTKNIPVIFLSARAGEESKIEGLEAGADDYLVKPFSAKELIVRVEANIKISRSRIAAEAGLRSILMQAPMSIALLMGKELRIELVNARSLEIWGRERHEVINKPVFEAMPELEQQFSKTLQDVWEGQTFLGNEVPVAMRRFGHLETIYVNFIYEPLRDENGTTIGIMAVGVDVTDLVLSRKITEQSEKELKVLADVMPQLVWVADEQGDVLYFNERISEFAGVHKKQDGRWNWKGLFHPKDEELTLRLWAQSIATGNNFEHEHRLRLKDGSYRWHISRAISQKNEQGKSIKWFGTTTDIHDAREQHDLLEKEVKVRTRELESVNKELKQSNDDLLQFAHVASHDLKEPVRKIKIFTGRLLTESKAVAETDRIFLNKIIHATERMSSMIEGVLNYSTLNASQQPIEKVNLDEIISNVESDLEILIQQRNATVIRKGILPEIEGASVLLHQLFYNLLNNSLKFSKPDRPPVIEIISEIIHADGNSSVLINFKDNGIGFGNESSKTIFDTFTRLNSKDLYEGTGIGLALCKKIVDRHHGNISATGVPDQGATISIELPLQQKIV